jgi:hypothetical protein
VATKKKEEKAATKKKAAEAAAKKKAAEAAAKKDEEAAAAKKKADAVRSGLCMKHVCVKLAMIVGQCAVVGHGGSKHCTGCTETVRTLHSLALARCIRHVACCT